MAVGDLSIERLRRWLSGGGVTALGVIALALAIATVAVAWLEGPPIGIVDASPVYLGAIVLVGSIFGTGPALLTAGLSFVLVDLLFTEPRFTFVVDDPKELLDLALFLVLGLVVGRISAVSTGRAIEASRRAAESTSLFAISRTLATAGSLEGATGPIVERLVADAHVDRVWITVEHAGRSRMIADSGAGLPLPISPIVTSLIRTPGEAPARWVRAHEPLAQEPPARDPRIPGIAAAHPAAHPAAHTRTLLRVRMEADGVPVGSLRASSAASNAPGRSDTRILALAADQLALAIRRDELRREATEAEIARRADALKSALLDAVSHDLRTPLASIRAAAGSLADPDVPLTADAARATGTAIDAEAQRLDRLVREILDLSRIEAGALRPEAEALDLADIVGPVVDRLRPMLGDRPIRIDIPADLPPVRADAVLLDGLIANLVENVGRHAPPPAAFVVRASGRAETIQLTVEDGGPGVPEGAVDGLFEKFVRGDGAAAAARRGLGIGLTIVRGFAEAMGATVTADGSPLGGLRVAVTLPVAGTPPADEPAT